MNSAARPIHIHPGAKREEGYGNRNDKDSAHVQTAKQTVSSSRTINSRFADFIDHNQSSPASPPSV